MIFRKDPQKLKARLLDLKWVKIAGVRFQIKKLNPLIDFSPDTMPQIFVDYLSPRKKEAADLLPRDLLRFQEDMKRIVEAGLVVPDLVPVGKDEGRGKEAGITIDDIFRDAEMGARLYSTIMTHSLNRFRGLKGVFFSIRMRYWQFTQLRKSLAVPPSKSSAPTATTA